MRKWLAGVAAGVISGLLVWRMTQSPARPDNAAPSYSLSGTWQYTQTSDVSGQSYQGSLRLVMDGSSVGGEFVEDFFDRSSKGVHGSFDGTTLELSRDTSKDTKQIFVLTKDTDSRFAGRFKNYGLRENTDSGTFEIAR